jgi:hypothetical protein
VKLISTDVFDINVDTNFREGAEIQPSRKPPRIIAETRHQQPLKQPSSNHRATIEQPLTNKEIRKEGNNDDSKALGNSVVDGQRNGSQASSSDFEVEEEDWKKFANWCASQKGNPTISGYKTWKKNQKPTLKSKSSKQGPKPQPEGWLEWVNSTYPGARVLDYWKVPGDIQQEFQRSSHATRGTQ